MKSVLRSRSLFVKGTILLAAICLYIARDALEYVFGPSSKIPGDVRTGRVALRGVADAQSFRAALVDTIASSEKFSTGALVGAAVAALVAIAVTLSGPQQSAHELSQASATPDVWSRQLSNPLPAADKALKEDKQMASEHVREALAVGALATMVKVFQSENQVISTPSVRKTRSNTSTSIARRTVKEELRELLMENRGKFGNQRKPVRVSAGKTPFSAQSSSFDFTAEKSDFGNDSVAFCGLMKVPLWFRGNEDCRLVYAAKEAYGCQTTPQGPHSAGGIHSNEIVLSVFDVSQVLNKDEEQSIKDMTSNEIDGMWHISLKAFGHHYDNPRMIDGPLPIALSPFLRYQYVFRAARTSSEFQIFFETIRTEEQFTLDKYDPVHNNCNHFQGECIKFLAPDARVDLITAPQVLSPVNFDRATPSRTWGKRFNLWVQRGIGRRMEELESERRLRIEQNRLNHRQLQTKFFGICIGLAVLWFATATDASTI